MKWPDTRGWVAIGLFLLTVMIFAMIALRPELADNNLFAMLAQAIVISALINGVVTFLYGSSKGSADKDATLAAALNDTPPNNTATTTVAASVTEPA